MTNIYIEKDGNRFLVNAEGHAGDVEACNYINGALYSFAGYAHNAEKAGFGTVLAFETDEKKGKMLIHCTGDQRVEAALDAAYIGLMQLQQARPQAVKIERHNEI